MLDYRKAQDHLLNEFLGAFGDRDAVLKEIEDFWATDKKSIDPTKIVEHLIDQRQSDGRIAANRAALFKQYFQASFSPDSATGYWPKHRMALTESLVTAYVKQHPEKPVYRIEADIVNLGGLNRALKKAGLKKRNANIVIRLMSGILREELGKAGELLAIRQGGDELRFYLLPGEKVTTSEIDAAFQIAQQRIAAFVDQAGLRDLAHTKADKPRGLGIGVAYVDDSEPSEIVKRNQLESAIADSKTQFYNMLPAASEKPSEIDLERLKSALLDQYATYTKPVELIKLPSSLEVGDSQESVDSSVSARLHRVFSAADSTKMNALETGLVRGMASLCRKIDPVTGLTMNGAIATDLLPNFMARFGNNAQLVHIDFNNLGGGNRLGSWVGDAMLKRFAECIEEALRRLDLQAFQPYLFSQDGGKFSLLLPATSDQESRQRLDALGETLRSVLTQYSNDALDLSQEQIEETCKRMRAIATDEISKRNERIAREGSHRPIPVNLDKVTLNDINSVKDRRSGVNVVCESLNVDLAEGIEWPTDVLEAMLIRGQDGIGRYHERAFQKQRLTQTQSSPDTRVSDWRAPERLAAVGKIKLSPPHA